MSAIELTDEEAAAIRSLRRLAKRWPSSLKLFSNAGSLLVVRNEIAPMEILDSVHGIPNDGGDADETVLRD